MGALVGMLPFQQALTAGIDKGARANATTSSMNGRVCFWLTKLERCLIDTPEVQRLRNLLQLGIDLFPSSYTKLKLVRSVSQAGDGHDEEQICGPTDH